ncbi:MAG: hypothetical protein L3J10_00980 [Sulfurimonas sp.]|nr:hypothetical protein [Sulfurimonas sp.]
MKLSILSSSLIVSLILILSGCGAKPKPKDGAVVDSTLPEIILTQNGTQSTMNSIALEWKPVVDKRVRGIYIYKKTDDSDKDTKNDFLETVDNRFSTHFLDDDVNPNSKYIYYFKTYTDAAESPKSKDYTVSTRKIFDSVSWLYAKGDMPRSAKIIWRPHKNKAVDAYIIQRKTLEDESFKDIAKVHGRLNVEYIDTKLKDKFIYMYQIRALTFDSIRSLPSDIVKISTKALPMEIKNITVTTNLAKKIKLNWDKTSSPDFLYYNIYRSQNVDSGYELIARVNNNTYIDSIEKDGEKYFYRISAIDKDTLQSNHEVNSVLGMTLVKPTPPTLLEAKLIDNKIVLKWENADIRTKKYIVIKKHKKSLFDFQEDQFNDIQSTNFVDADILPNSSYSYYVFSVDENGIFSEPSIEIKFETKELKSSMFELRKIKPLAEETKIEKIQIEKTKIEEIKIEEIDFEEIDFEEI